MSVVERFLRERPISFTEAMESSPRDHLIEFWNWLDDEGYLSTLPPETGAKVRSLITAVNAAACELGVISQRLASVQNTYQQSPEVASILKLKHSLETALEPFKPLLENRHVHQQEDDPDRDRGPASVD